MRAYISVVTITKDKRNGVKKKKRKRIKNGIKTRSAAVLVLPTNGTSYASVLKDLRTKFSLGNAEQQMKAVRKTRNGALQLEMTRGKSDRRVL